MVDQAPRRQSKTRITNPEQRRGERAQDYVYHWDRIIGALAAFVFLLAAFGYGVYAWLRPSELPATAKFEEQQRTPDPKLAAGSSKREELQSVAEPSASETLPEPASAEEPVDSGSEDIAEAPASMAPSADRASLEPAATLPGDDTSAESVEMGDFAATVTEEEVSEPSSPPKTSLEERIPSTAPEQAAADVAAQLSDPQPGDVASPDVESDDGAPEGSEEEAMSEPEPESSVADASEKPLKEAPDDVSESESVDVVTDSTAAEQSGEGTALRPRKTSIASPAVKRFQLAKDVVSHEPKGDIGDIAPEDGRYAKIAAFSEVVDLGGETLNYLWLHDGKEVARVRVSVGSDRWRSYSTKKIFPDAKGPWRAELRNSAGDLLASIDFTY